MSEQLTLDRIRRIDEIGPTVPHARGSDTSRAAAASIRVTVSSKRGRVLAFVLERRAKGATCDEVEEALEMSHQTASARVYELRGAKLIVDSTNRRVTRSGGFAAVYVAPEHAGTVAP